MTVYIFIVEDRLQNERLESWTIYTQSVCERINDKKKKKGERKVVGFHLNEYNVKPSNQLPIVLL